MNADRELTVLGSVVSAIDDLEPDAQIRRVRPNGCQAWPTCSRARTKRQITSLGEQLVEALPDRDAVTVVMDGATRRRRPNSEAARRTTDRPTTTLAPAALDLGASGAATPTTAPRQ